jgi:hypothetical protein
MMQPKQKPSEATPYKRAHEEPPELRDSYESHQNKAMYYHRTDGMPAPLTSPVSAEWHDLQGAWFGVLRNNFPPVPNLDGLGNLLFSV